VGHAPAAPQLAFAQRQQSSPVTTASRPRETAGGKSPADTAACVQELKAAKRYARDVY
jgi:hypothetical protein